ncbi:putative GTP-binding protein EngB [Xylanibacillus composti]|uniref:Probable GTP-binding protein EngB n=1 Tax=Xylanibacillus composti TaxID=1572762 RepID=A0A8J4M3K6_9BACL|nr:ribosome biogenesis GTP-binding protein YihA/YsxC [Xylanibacillus composti]GIQ70205.1 putative GTP-binding protein EngB [Xylanibacillus composti]
MKVTQAEFVISAAAPHQFPQDALPEIALAGRSNVGKSSLINRMLQRKSLARTSSQPGKTQTLNYYRINGQLYFVDFPGYGYAKVSKVQRKKWGELIEAYLREREPLRLVLLIVDLRHAPTEDDCLMYDWMQHYDIPCLVVATKADKLPRSKWQKHIRLAQQTLGMPEGQQPLLFSSESGLGREELWSYLVEAIHGGEPEFFDAKDDIT